MKSYDKSTRDLLSQGSQSIFKNTFKKLLASILKVDWGVMVNPILQVGIPSIRLEEKTSFRFVKSETEKKPSQLTQDQRM